MLQKVVPDFQTTRNWSAASIYLACSEEPYPLSDMVLFIDDIRKDLAMKKTWIVWLTCLALTMSLLGGCASKPEETTDVAQEDTAAEEIQEETSQEETVQEESETAPADPVPEEEPGTGEQTAQTPAQTPEETPQQPSQTPAQTPPQPAQEPA
ncbi:MAG: hypothetical protein IKN28_03470, partial [Firmicutes bacterium]|nr:hypothetical protein [Bacillota bacterium]